MRQPPSVSPPLRLITAGLVLTLLAGCQSGGPQLVENQAPITAPSSNPPVAVEAPPDAIVTPEEAQAAIPESVPETAPAEAAEEKAPEKTASETTSAKSGKKETVKTTSVDNKKDNKPVSHPVPAASNPPAKAVKEETFSEGELDAPPNPEKPKPSKSENLKNASIKVPEKR